MRGKNYDMKYEESMVGPNIVHTVHSTRQKHCIKYCMVLLVYIDACKYIFAGSLAYDLKSDLCFLFSLNN